MHGTLFFLNILYPLHFQVNFGYRAEFTNYTSYITLRSSLICLSYMYRSGISYNLMYVYMRLAVCENMSVSGIVSYSPPLFPEGKYMYQHCPQGLEMNNITVITEFTRNPKSIQFFCGKYYNT